ncbi:MAG: ribonuclease H-like domain-containing protein [Deltaproteobacteria bacterium]|nr:ribonuclease H-like domain-containing protein [Deltaproteobacteria bacterium]
MADLLDRLRRHLPGADAVPMASPRQDRAPELPGHLEETSEGPLRIVREEVRQLPGPVPDPAACLVGEVTRHHVLLADPRLAGFHRDRALFVDIEATGLSRGAGTLAFLLGTAWFEGSSLVLEQLLAEHPGQERAALHRFLIRLQERSHFVSYNGKSYDLSVLQSRMVMHRFMDAPEAALRLRPHLDLLHSGRRVWRGILPDHRLRTLEATLLGMVRDGDIPGARVPHLYFAFLAGGDAGGLLQVLEHNRRDILSMVSLSHVLLAALSPETGGSSAPVLRLNRARIHDRAGCWDAVVRELDARTLEGLGAAAREEARRLLDRARRRTRD